MNINKLKMIPVHLSSLLSFIWLKLQCLPHNFPSAGSIKLQMPSQLVQEFFRRRSYCCHCYCPFRNLYINITYFQFILFTAAVQIYVYLLLLNYLRQLKNLRLTVHLHYYFLLPAFQPLVVRNLCKLVWVRFSLNLLECCQCCWSYLCSHLTQPQF